MDCKTQSVNLAMDEMVLAYRPSSKCGAYAKLIFDQVEIMDIWGGLSSVTVLASKVQIASATDLHYTLFDISDLCVFGPLYKS